MYVVLKLEGSGVPLSVLKKLNRNMSERQEAGRKHVGLTDLYTVQLLKQHREGLKQLETLSCITYSLEISWYVFLGCRKPKALPSARTF